VYVELHCHTPYSFLDGASDIDELVQMAAEIGMPSLAVTDHNSLTAAVKFASACKQYDMAISAAFFRFPMFMADVFRPHCRGSALLPIPRGLSVSPVAVREECPALLRNIGSMMR
jgi:hypothetical protein